MDGLGWHDAPPPPPPPPPAPPPSSWSLPGPLILTASDPSSADGHAGVGSIGRIVQPGAAPVWECLGNGRTGYLAQIEGDSQYEQARRFLLEECPAGVDRAVVTTGGVTLEHVAELVAGGVTVAFMELNPQAGWEPYGNTARMLDQALRDGWPHQRPSYGCYDGIGLDSIENYVPLVWDDQRETWRRGDGPQGLVPAELGAVFSAEGAGDTNSWPAIANWR